MAETNHDAEANLRKLYVPLLMICGDKDIYFSMESVRKTASINSAIQLKVYEGRGHIGVLNDKRLPGDVLAFIQHHTA